MVEPIGVALHAINLTQISVNDTAVVGAPEWLHFL
jgi:hypothetical protein